MTCCNHFEKLNVQSILLKSKRKTHAQEISSADAGESEAGRFAMACC